jgi:hypothetical protein
LGAAGAGPITFEAGRQILQIENAALSANTFGDTIDSFGRGDAIDLKGLAFQAGATANYDANRHMLTVTSNGITDTLILTNPDGTAFKALGDGASGTDIVLIPAVTEALKNDTGSSSTDKITKDPTLTGSGDANAVVGFTVDGTPITAKTTADSFGNWTFNPTGLSDGQHTVIASETDAAGNTGTATLTFKLDSTAPVDVITGDTLNQNGSFTLKGTAEAGNSIKIYDGSTLLGSTTAGSNGLWSFTTNALSKTIIHSFTSTATDIAGNVGQSTGSAIYGTASNDPIYSTPGNDILTGGSGADTFVFKAAFGKDTITDFVATGAGHDVLQFDHSIFATNAAALAHSTQVGSNVVIAYDAADTITLVGVSLHQLSANDFHII